MPRSKTGAGPGHTKSRYGAKRVIFYFFKPWSKTKVGPGHLKVCAGQWVIFYYLQLRYKTRARKK